VNDLRPYYAKIAALVSEIDGSFVNLFEAGIFVASIATLKILSFRKVDSQKFADEFNVRWINYLVDSYEVGGESLAKNHLVSRLQEKFHIYGDLFIKTLDSSDAEKSHNNSVQLMWELFSNCTEKKKPDTNANFLNLVMASDQLVFICGNIFNDIDEESLFKQM